MTRCFLGLRPLSSRPRGHGVLFWGIVIVIRAGLRDLPGRRQIYLSCLMSLSWMHHAHGLSSPTYPPLGRFPGVEYCG